MEAEIRSQICAVLEEGSATRDTTLSRAIAATCLAGPTEESIWPARCSSTSDTSGNPRPHTCR